MSTNRELINPAGMHPAPGFSHIAVTSAPRTAFIAGQVALAEDFSVIGGDDLFAQSVAAMRNVEVALRSIDAGWDQVVRRTIYTTAPTEFETITRAIEQVQESTDHPAQTIVGITGLAIPGLLIEIEVTVALS